MAFIDRLSIDKEKSEFLDFLKNTTWEGSCEITHGYVSSSPSLSLYAVHPETGDRELFFTVGFTHWIPQPVGHLLLPGSWSITDIKLSGPLVDDYCRLAALRAVAGHVFKEPTSSSANSQYISQLKAELAKEKEGNLVLQERLKQQAAQIAGLEEGTKVLASKNQELSDRVTQLLQQTKNNSKDKGKRPVPKPAEPSDVNLDIFQQWAATPDAR